MTKPIKTTPSIRMGEMAVGRDGEELRTLLGSCVGVALFDTQRRVGGLAHVVLPDSRGSTAFPGKFADTAVPKLLEELRNLAGSELRVRAKIAGGANMFPTENRETIGEQNLAAVEKLLGRLGISILGRHCGGEQGRQMILDTLTGKVKITVVGCGPVEI